MNSYPDYMSPIQTQATKSSNNQPRNQPPTLRKHLQFMLQI